MAVPDKLLKPYDPKETEARIYKLWEESGFFNPDNLPGDRKETFSIVLPPPNVTGTLHMGSALMLAVEDIMVRYARMQGKKTLWIPGTDHAAIATQSKVEKIIEKEEGKRRHDLGREELLRRIDIFAKENHDVMVKQIKALGGSLDWSREAFTLDENRSSAVIEAFKRMYDAGLIYRGYRVVNWDPKGQTTVSDDEVDHKTEKGMLYTFRYDKDFPILVSTTRPETKVGDTAVAVHPEDARYKKYIGQTFEANFAGKKLSIKIVADEAADPEFGTGAVGVTPAHSQTDFEIKERHDLPLIQVIDEFAKMTEEAGPLVSGKKTKEARELIVNWLKENDLVEKEEEIEMNISIAERTGGVIEPLPKLQWFVDVNKKIKDRGDKSLKELMIEAVEKDGIKILPDRFEKIYYHWIENLRDWCISRQIWYGHRIPVWYKGDEIKITENKKLFLVRHGESEAGANGVYAGQNDTPLTDKGREDVKHTAELLKGKNITKIITTPMSRARETAQIISGQINVGIEVWDEAIEFFADSVQGSPIEKGKSIINVAVNNGVGEKLEDFYLRVSKLLEKIKKIETEGDILFVGHAGIFLVIQAILDGIPAAKYLAEEPKLMTKVNGVINRDKIIFRNLNMIYADWNQDEDTLDTWFSSGLWTFSTLGWPNETSDLKTFHPTSVLETGYDILFFWVARMILMSKFLLNDIPFKTVYLHGLVRDAKGQKISKSLGNNVDPLDMIAKYGSDAVRMSLIIGTSPGNDSKMSEDKIKAYRNFSNKLWNITRFVLGKENTGVVDPKLKTELDEITKDITSDMENNRFYLAGEKLYHYVWHRFADEIIEESKQKPELDASLYYLLENSLKLLHPFMPFVTEELWSMLPHEEEKLLIIEAWPTV